MHSTPRRQSVMTALMLVLGILVPGIIALRFVKTFGVNIPVHDEWHFMHTVDTFYAGSHWPAQLIDHYGEHRIPIPKAIILGLAPFTKYNVKDEMYLSALLMMVGAFVIWRLLKATNAPAWLIIPIGWLFVSIAQYQNLLVGWQFQIPLMNVFVLLTVLLLSKEPLRFREQAAAGVAAFGATFSFANGLLIWPAVVLLVAVRKRSFRKAIPWFLLMIAAVYLYTAGYTGFHRNPHDQTPKYLESIKHDPGAVASLFVAVAGNSFGAGTVTSGVVAGIVMIVFLLLVAIALRQSIAPFRWPAADAPEKRLNPYPWLALALFSLMSVGAIAAGRSAGWRDFATSSRYITVAIFIPIAIIVLGAELLRRLPPRTTVARIAIACCAIVVSAAVWQHIRTIRAGRVVADATHSQNLSTMPCLLNYRTAPASCLQNLYSADGLYVRQNAVTLERWKIGPFAGTKQDYVSDVVGTIEGTIDVVQIGEEKGSSFVIAEGWGLVAGQSTPGTAALFVDGDFIDQTSEFFSRPDVNQFFKKTLPPVGWKIQATLPGLRKGDHKVQAMLISRGGKVLGMLGAKSVQY